jgi:hypothetical protein
VTGVPELTVPDAVLVSATDVLAWLIDWVTVFDTAAWKLVVPLETAVTSSLR